MRIIVKNDLCEKQFQDKTGRMLAYLRSQKLFGPEKVIIGPDKEVKYLTSIENLPEKRAGENHLYKLMQGDMLVATAQPLYAAGADHFALTKPPRPIGLSIDMLAGEQWKVKRGDKNSAEIHTSNEVAKLSDFFSVRPQVFEVPDGNNVFLWVGVYALIGYMMHEDDTYPV